MKGFYIFEEEFVKGTVDCLEIGYIDHTFTHQIDSGTLSEEVKMHALVSKGTKSKCSKDDTYDFETGALIALMKMCGKEKALKAVEELYSLMEPRGADLDGDILESKVEHMAKKNAELLGENSRLNYIKSCNESTIESLENTRDLLINKNNELIEENEKLKSDKDKSWKNYQRKIQKKQDRINQLEAQVIASRVIWCTSQSSTRDYLDSLIEGSKYAIPYTTEWIKPPTKREEMWDEIFAIHKEKHPIIVVKKEDINTFLHEIENKNPKITWASGVKIFEAKGTIKDIYIELKRCDTIYFRLQKSNKLSYSTDPYIYPYYDFEHISYLPPMRWDLFKKGRLAVKVTYRNYKEFYEACEKELGKKPSTYFSSDYTVSICKKDGLFEVFTVGHQKTTGKKIVNWEDVR